MHGPKTNDPRTWRREWPERRESRGRERYERGPEFPNDARRRRPYLSEMHDPEMHDPRTGEPVHGPAAYRGGSGSHERWSGRTDDDDRYPAGTMQAADSWEDATPWNRDADMRYTDRSYRYTGRGYHYPGGARYPEASGRRDARRRAHFDEHWSWDPEDRDELWRRGEYGSRLHGNVVGAATPSGTAGIRRYDAAGVERRGPKGYVRSDERLQDDICMRLAAESWLDLSEVDVHVNDGHVRLDGEVPDRSSRHAIEDIAEGAWGVKDVDNRIRIRAT